MDQGCLIALAALAFPLDSIRVMITDANPPCLPHLLAALSHPSYGVRAAACQLTRALSRTVSLVRTSLIDSGISDAIIDTLRREVQARGTTVSRTTDSDYLEHYEADGEVWKDRPFVVETTALMTLSNLAADFSPLKTVSTSVEPWSM